MKDIRVGVDLGTCYSSVGFRDGKGLHYLKDPAAAQLSYSVPSSALVLDDQQMVFGALAESEKTARPDCYQSQFKRDLGSKIPYQLGDQLISAADLTARFLTFMIEATTDTLGNKPNEAVITVPATYDTYRRSLIEEAARSAGLTQMSMVSEPVAAVVYAADREDLPPNGTVLVYDLGGGTFDAAIVRLDGDHHQVLGARGLADFGGTDIDLLIERDLAEQAGDELAALLSGQDSDDPRVRRRALRARIAARDMCREVKHRLSSADHASSDLNLTISYELSRSELTAMVQPSLDRTIATCRQLATDIGVEWDQISGVLLVGGPCRMPCVRETVARELSRPVWKAAEPELAVCAGATLMNGNHDSTPPSVRTPPAATEPTEPTVASAGGAPVAAQRRGAISFGQAREFLPDAITDSLVLGELDTQLVVSAMRTPEKVSPNRSERVERIVRTLQNVSGVHLRPNIPAKKLTNAYGSTRAPVHEEVIALVDMTIFGSAKDAILITAKHMYYRHMNFPGQRFQRPLQELPAEIRETRGKLQIGENLLDMSPLPSQVTAQVAAALVRLRGVRGALKNA